MIRYSVATATMTRDPRRGIVAAGTLGHKALRTLSDITTNRSMQALTANRKIRKALQRLG
jgi:hypothetical protein